MVEQKTWEKFRQTGLLLLLNQFLHIFGWAIVLHYNEKQEIEKVYPARVNFVGLITRIRIKLMRQSQST